MGVLCWSLFWYALLYVRCRFALILTRERAGCFAFIVFGMSCYCKCSMALPRGAVGSSAVRDCGIFRSYLLTFSKRIEPGTIRWQSKMSIETVS